jgi:RIO kinase 1
MRAMANRTAFGKELISVQWAKAEFGALSHLWEVGQESGMVCVPYPVQLIGTELMQEFIGDWETGEAAPRLAQTRPDPDGLRDLWRQLVDALSVLARTQIAHGDLSPYNLLVHHGRLVMIDLPQVVDVVANPQGADFIARDVRNVASWFAARGLAADVVDVEGLIERVLYESGLR